MGNINQNDSPTNDKAAVNNPSATLAAQIWRENRKDFGLAHTAMSGHGKDVNLQPISFQDGAKAADHDALAKWISPERLNLLGTGVESLSLGHGNSVISPELQRQENKDREKADAIFDQLIKNVTAQFGGNSHETAEALQAVGNLYELSSHFGKAKECYQKGLAAAKMHYKYPDNPQDNPLVPLCGASAAAIDHKFDKLEDAKKGYEEALRDYAKGDVMRFGRLATHGVMGAAQGYADVLTELAKKKDPSFQNPESQDLMNSARKTRALVDVINNRLKEEPKQKGPTIEELKRLT